MQAKDIKPGMIFRSSDKLIEETRLEISKTTDKSMKEAFKVMENFLYHDFHIASIDYENEICSISSVILSQMSNSLGHKDECTHYHLIDVIRIINSGYWIPLSEEEAHGGF